MAGSLFQGRDRAAAFSPDHRQKAALPVPPEQEHLCRCGTGKERYRKAGHCAVQQRRISENRFAAHRQEPVHSVRRTDPALCTGDFLPPHYQEQVPDPDHSQRRH